MTTIVAFLRARWRKILAGAILLGLIGGIEPALLAVIVVCYAAWWALCELFV
jgi:hypothetical protein